MKTRELIFYSRRRIKGRRRAVLLACMMPLGTGLFFLAAEAALYSLMLYFGSLRPAELFTGGCTEQLMIAGIFLLLRAIVLPPMWYGAVIRIREITEDSPENTSFSDILLNGRAVLRSVLASLFGRVVSAIALAPAVASGVVIYKIVSRGTDTSGLFTAYSALAVGIASMWLWAVVRTALLAVPYLLAEYPEISAFRAVVGALRFMRGRCRMPVRLGAAYLLPMCTVIPIPYLLPEVASAFTIGVSIYFNEDRYLMHNS